MKVWICVVSVCLLAHDLQAGEVKQSAATYRVPRFTEGEAVSASRISDDYIGRACTVFLKLGHSLEGFSGSADPPGMISYEGRAILVSGEMDKLWEEGKFTVRAHFDSSCVAFKAKHRLIPYEDIDKIIFESSSGRKLRALMAEVGGKAIRRPISALRDGDVVHIHRFRDGYTVDAELVVDKDLAIPVPFGRETLTFYGLSENEVSKTIFFASLWYDLLGPCSVEFSRPLFFLKP